MIEKAVSCLEKREYEEWHRFAFLATVIANIFGRKGKRFKPSDFIGEPPWIRRKKEKEGRLPVTQATVAMLKKKINERMGKEV